MSAGKPFRSFRISNELTAEVQDTIQRRNAHSIRSPWTFASFIIAAIREKIDKMKRSRRWKRHTADDVTADMIGHLCTETEWADNAKALEQALNAPLPGVTGPAHLEEITEQALAHPCLPGRDNHQFRRLYEMGGHGQIDMCVHCELKLWVVNGEHVSID